MSDIILPNQQPPIQVAAPFNDIQLIVLAASNMSLALPTEDAIDRAIQLVAQAVVRFRSNALNAAIEKIENGITT